MNRHRITVTTPPANDGVRYECDGCDWHAFVADDAPALDIDEAEALAAVHVRDAACVDAELAYARRTRWMAVAGAAIGLASIVLRLVAS